MIEKLVTLYRKAEIGIISSLSGITENILEENAFYNLGYMKTLTKRLQKRIGEITQELKINIEYQNGSKYDLQQRNQLLEEKERLVFSMIFLASNSFGNLSDCIKMGNGYDFKFMQCVRGLQEYQMGKKQKAYLLLKDYVKEHNGVEGHYLINKVYGLLLMENGDYSQAITYLTYAQQFVPDDIECLQAIESCYRYVRNVEKQQIIQEVLSVLA